MLVTDISNEAYHGSGELSRSTAWSLLTQCPAKVKYDRENPGEATPALIIGDAFHTATLEPARFETDFACKPEQIDGKSPLTNHYKEIFAEMQSEEPHVKWLNRSDYQMVVEMAGSALDHPILKEHLGRTESIVEGTAYFECEGVKCKVRPDLYSPGAGVVIDLKSTMDASERGFSKSVRQFGYSFQVAWYLEGLRLAGEKPNTFIFLAVEKKAPYLTAAYKVSAAEIEKQTHAMYKACTLWNECVSSGVYPGYTDEVTQVDVDLRVNLKRNRLTIKEMAEHFGVSRSFIYSILNQFKVDCQFVGNRRMYDIADMASAMKQYNTKKVQEHNERKKKRRLAKNEH